MIGQGDLVNQTEKLKKYVKKIKYQGQITSKDLCQQNPEIFLLLLHYILVDYSDEFYQIVLQKGYDLYSKTDLRFMESTYRLLVKEFHYKPQITLMQFFTPNYLEQKVILTNEIIEIVIENSPKKQGVVAKQQETESNNILFQKPQKGLNAGEEQEEDEDEADEQQQLHVQAPVSKISPKQQQKKNEQQQCSLPSNLHMHENYQQEQEALNNEQQQRPNIIRNGNQNQILNNQNNRNGSSDPLSNITNSLNQISSMEQFFNQETQQFKQQNAKINEKPAVQKLLQIPSHNQQQQQQQSSELLQQSDNQTVTKREINEVLKLIVDMNKNVNAMMGKFENYKNEINSWVQNIGGQLILLDNQVKVIKSQQQQQQQQQQL